MDSIRAESVAADRPTDVLLLGNDSPSLSVGYYFRLNGPCPPSRLLCQVERAFVHVSGTRRATIDFPHCCLRNLSVWNGSIVYCVWADASWNRLTTKASYGLSANGQALLASPATFGSWLRFCAYRAHFFVFCALTLPDLVALASR